MSGHGRDAATAWPGSATRLLGVIGHPVGHSLSPTMHNAALAAAGIDMAYVAVDVAPGDLADALRGLGPLGFVGANVTVPHKQAVAAACDSLSDEAALVGAVNTVVVTGASLHGHNTDTAGFLAGLPGDLPAGRAVVLGAGGAARAVVVALARTGWSVQVLARRSDAAATLVTAVAAGVEAAVSDHAGVDRGEPRDTPGEPRGRGDGPVSLGAADLGDAVGAVAAADLVVNATPLGLEGEPLPEAFMHLRADQVAYDLVYNPAVTPFLAGAATAGATAVGGLEMLVNQAAEAFEVWTGVAPDRDVMTAAARQALDVHA